MCDGIVYGCVWFVGLVCLFVIVGFVGWGYCFGWCVGGRGGFGWVDCGWFVVGWLLCYLVGWVYRLLGGVG